MSIVDEIGRLTNENVDEIGRLMLILKGDFDSFDSEDLANYAGHHHLNSVEYRVLLFGYAKYELENLIYWNFVGSRHDFSKNLEYLLELKRALSH